jgi:hypothetical protein
VSPLKIKIPSKNMHDKLRNTAVVHIFGDGDRQAQRH